MAITDAFVADLQRQRRELVEALAKVDAALEIFNPTPATATRVPTGKRRKRSMREGSINALIINIARNAPETAWDGGTMRTELEARGWTTDAKDAEHSVRAALYTLYRKGTLKRVGTGKYQWIEPDTSFGPAASTAGPREAGEDASSQEVVQTEPEALKLPA